MEKMEFTRGDPAYHAFFLPADIWSAGGRLFFAAKPLIDDDNTDANAQISGSWDDSSVTDVTRNGIAYKRYACNFPASATNSIVSGGADSAEYKGEFQWVPNGGEPITFPPDDQKIPTIIYFDVKRKTTV